MTPPLPDNYDVGEFHPNASTTAIVDDFALLGIELDDGGSMVGLHLSITYHDLDSEVKYIMSRSIAGRLLNGLVDFFDRYPSEGTDDNPLHP